MKLILIRHGQTSSNHERRFLGLTDEPLTPEGRAGLSRRAYPPVQRLFASPLLRCLQTAALIYPDLEPEIIPDLREMDFGRFEGKTNLELSAQPFYQEWLAAGRADFPEGETMTEFARRCSRGFQTALAGLTEAENAALVIHGGSIMAILAAWCGGNFYDYMCDNGGGFVCSWQEKCMQIEEKL